MRNSNSIRLQIYLNFSAIILLLLIANACSPSGTNSDIDIQVVALKAETMGTTATFTYLDSSGQDYSKEIEELLTNFNQSVSTYIKDSEISTFNQQDSVLTPAKGHFIRNYDNALKVYQLTEGWFNPTVMPLVNYWGFGYTAKRMVTETDSSKIDSLLTLVDLGAVQYQVRDSTVLYFKNKQGIELDFSAIAKGDAVDVVGRLLENKGINNYYIEIGGEVRTRGKTASGFSWRTGIRSPRENGPVNDLQLVLELEDISLATSGNYENYHEDKTTGIKYAHTINPHTGYPQKNNLLSVSVFTADCAIADALATGFMAMGLEKAFEIAEKETGIEAYFIYSDQDGNFQEKMTSGVAAMIKK